MLRYKGFLSSNRAISRSTMGMRKLRDRQRLEQAARQQHWDLCNANVPPIYKDQEPAATTAPTIFQEDTQSSVSATVPCSEMLEAFVNARPFNAEEEAIEQSQNPDATQLNLDDEVPVSAAAEEDLHRISAFFNYEGEEKPERLPPLCSHTDSTPDDVMVMVLTLFVRHSLTYVCVEDFLKIFNVIYGPDTIKHSKFSILKRMGIPDKIKDVTYHLFCDICCIHIKKPENAKEVNCPKCEKSLSLNNTSTYFGAISFESQLKALLSKEGVAEMILHHRFSRTKSNHNNLEDIYDGSEYKRWSAPGQILSRPENFSYSFFIDGVPFGNTKKSLWPIYATINELPPEHRRNNMILIGLYYGAKEPNQSFFLKPFVEEANKLSGEGFKWSYKGCDVHSKVIPLVAIADSAARFKLLNMQSFGAFYGCTFCYQITQPTIKRHKFVIPARPAKQRTELSYERDMKEVFKRRFEVSEKKQFYKGVKGPACLKSLNYFSIFTGFVVDHMHNILLGVCKLYFELAFDPKNRKMWNLMRDNELFALDDLLSVIDERLLSIKPPSVISRTPRTIKNWSNWKANEWRSWLLYYSIPCLKGIMKKNYLRHYSMLVVAYQLLMQKSVCPTADVPEADRLLKLFSELFQEYFGPENMMYNIHLLQHVCQGVLHWGPLWTHNAFMYEAFNRILLGLAKNPNTVLKEVLQKYLILRELPKLVPKFVVSDLALEFCEEMLERRLVRCSQSGSCYLLDAPKTWQHLPSDYIPALQHFNINVKTSLFYDRILCNGLRISVSQYSEKYKICNSIIYTSSVVGRVLAIVQTSQNNTLMLVQEIKPRDKSILRRETVAVTHIQSVELYGCIGLLSPQLVIGMCVMSETEKGTYFSKVSLAVNGD